jgi:hypothetical protein
VGTGASAEGLLRWPQDGSPALGPPGAWTRQQDVWRPARSEHAGRQRGRSWWPPLESGKGTHDDQQALTPGWTGVTRAEGWAPGRGGLRRGVRSGGRGDGGGPRQAELPLVQEGPMAGTPQPIGADCVAPVGQHMRQKAPDELVGGHRHGFPTLVLGVLVANAHLARIDGEETGVGQRETSAKHRLPYRWLRHVRSATFCSLIKERQYCRIASALICSGAR